MLTVKLFSRSIRHLILTAYAVLQATIWLFSSTGQATEYRFQPSIALMVENDDNVRLKVSDDEIENLQGSSTIVNADFSRNQTNNSLNINGRLARHQYDLNQYNSEDFLIGSNYQHNFERGSLSLNLRASDESIRTLENQPQNDGSTEEVATKVRSYSLALTGQRQLTMQQFLRNQFIFQQQNFA